MSDKERRKAQLEEELVQVKHRMQLLDMVEERMIRIRELAQFVVDHKLSPLEMQVINQEVDQLQEEIKLLNSEATPLS